MTKRSILLLVAGCVFFVGCDDGEEIETPEVTVPAASGEVWVPAPGTTWQWQLDGDLDTSVDAVVYDIDLFDHEADVVAGLHAQGRRAIAYVSVGSWENWRSDKDQFPDSVLGNDYDGWPGEKWLDIRQIALLAPVIRARLDLCVAKGFDAIEPDNIDGYQNDTGFPLTADDQIAFNTWLAAEAHARGLSIGLKNDPDQAGQLVDHFDWAMTEDAFDEGWYGQMSPFVQAGKAVFAAEYTDTGVVLADICDTAEAGGFSLILKKRDLDAWIEICP
ncbi:MAG: endo alpha-1,4 polygalactosaminidase [Lentisphaerae bacterium]|nr:endo alpha-1,4 polygalactosaminidase [Lentisphaerota bacterium]